MNKDYRLKVTIRNDRLLTAMENMGFESVAQFTQTQGLNYQRTGEIFNGKLKPLNNKGELTSIAKEILSILNLETDEAFTERQLKGFVKTSFEKRIEELHVAVNVTWNALYVSLFSTIEANIEYLFDAYKEAIKLKYRFYSFGDAMFIY